MGVADALRRAVRQPVVASEPFCMDKKVALRSSRGALLIATGRTGSFNRYVGDAAALGQQLILKPEVGRDRVRRPLPPTPRPSHAGFNSVQHSAPTPRWHRRPLPLVSFWKATDSTGWVIPAPGGSRDSEPLPQILKGHIFVVAAREGTRMGGAGRKHEHCTSSPSDQIRIY